LSQPLGKDKTERYYALTGFETTLMPSKNPQDDTSFTLMMRLGQSPADDAAWDRFVERYRPMIRDWCLKWGAQAPDADDVAQEVLTKLVSAMRTFRYDPDRSFRAWLKTVTQNAWTDFTKSHRLRTVGDPGLIHSIADSHDALIDLERQMEEALDREVLELAMHRVEKRVKPATWQAFYRTVIDNRPGPEVARELGMQVAHVFVAKHRVQKLLEQEVRAL
jgi:RNA polymerase sigma-70 factor (ECF subfamily)